MSRPWIYVATPYKADPDFWVEVCRRTMQAVFDAGGVPLATQPTYHGLTCHGESLDSIVEVRQEVLDVGQQLIKLAHGAVFHPNFEISAGMRDELELVVAYKVPYVILNGDGGDVDFNRIQSLIRRINEDPDMGYDLNHRRPDRVQGGKHCYE